MERYYEAARQMRRPSTILDTVSLVGLTTFMIFWLNVTWSLFAPLTPLSVQALYCFMLSLGMTVALPALLSALLPSTPAGMMLQRARWRTWGFAATLGGALFLLWFAWQVFDAWLYQFPNITRANVHTSLTIASLIIGVVIPTLSWVQIAPDRWLAEVVQAHKVRQLELMFQAQLDAMKAQFARNALLIQRGMANLSAGEAEELVASQEAIHRAINRTLVEIAQSIDVVTGRSTGVNLLPGEDITVLYDNLAAGLERAQIRMREIPAIAAPAPADYVELAPASDLSFVGNTLAPAGDLLDPPAPPVARPDAEMHDRAGAPVSAPALASTARHGPPRPASAPATGDEIDRAAKAARPHLPGAWTRSKLEAVLSVEKTKALDLIRAWKARGYVYDITRPANHYAWTQAEEA